MRTKKPRAESRTLAGSDRREGEKKKTLQTMIIQTHRLKDTSEAERDKMAPLSTGEAAELPDSTYPGKTT